MGFSRISKGIDEIKQLLFYNLRYTFLAAKRDRQTYILFRDKICRYLPAQKKGDLRVLDIGCGQRYFLSLLLNKCGFKAIGIDRDFIPLCLKHMVWVYRYNGLKNFIKRLLRKIFFDPLYYGRLFEADKSTFPVKIIVMDAEALAFKNGIFDAAVSNDTFEHIRDVGRALREIMLVLKKDGICAIKIHLFPSISGGHRMEWLFSEVHYPAHIAPWDHLRGNIYPAPVYLNGLKGEDYRNLFQDFEILQWEVIKREGERFLTQEILNELKEYSKEDLLQREILIVARKKS